MLQRADAALYAAKRGGRNCVRCEPDVAPCRTERTRTFRRNAKVASHPLRLLLTARGSDPREVGRAPAAHPRSLRRHCRSHRSHRRRREYSACPATVAAQLHDPGPVLVCAGSSGGLVALFGALTLAELAGALPRSGGIFAYLLESFGPLPAFLFGWTELTVIRASALGATATIFAEYVGYFVTLTPAQVRYIAAAAIVAIGALNYVGAQRAAARDERCDHRQVRGGPGAWVAGVHAPAMAAPRTSARVGHPECICPCSGPR